MSHDLDHEYVPHPGSIIDCKKGDLLQRISIVTSVFFYHCWKNVHRAPSTLEFATVYGPAQDIILSQQDHFTKLAAFFQYTKEHKYPISVKTGPEHIK